MRRILSLLFIMLLLGSGAFVWYAQNTAPSETPQETPAPENTAPPTSLPQNTPQETPQPPAPTIVPPIAEMQQRITKKFFGTYITPETSPVQPERFTGYHTGVDVEYGDVTNDIPVIAIAQGTVLFSGTVSGYGGVVVIRHTINDQWVLALYGHLDPKSLVAKGNTISAGQQIAILRDAYTDETAGERKHLHFGILKDGPIDYRGYVQNKSDLSRWYDPRTFF